MREIKFRQAQFNKDRSFREWHYWGFTEQYGEMTFVGPISPPDPAGALKDSYQYTGLKDKNGTRIYEGDILRHIPAGVLDTKMQIVWQDGSFYTAWGDGLTSHILNQIFSNCSEVIGNIYENPELLREEV